MMNSSRPPPIDYVYHVLNSSSSKSAYSFTKQSRFKTDTSPSKDNRDDTNSTYSPIIKSSVYEAAANKGEKSEMVSMDKSKQTKQRSKKQVKLQKQKDEYYGYEGKSNNKKDQYTIFPVRKSIDQLVKQMQELRFIFKSGFKQKKFITGQRKDATQQRQRKDATQQRQRKDATQQNKRDGYNNSKIDRDSSRYSQRAATPQRSRSAINTDRFTVKKADSQQSTRQNSRLYNSGVNDMQGNRRRSVSPFDNYIQSTFRNSSAFSFATSPRRLFNTTNQQGDHKFDFYAPFSEFGPNKHHRSQDY